MAGKVLFVFCAQALLIQSVYSQCLGLLGAGPLSGSLAGAVSPLATLSGQALAAPALAYEGCGVASTGGGFAVTSASPIAPTGVTIVSENAIEGALAVEGNLPLLGAVGLEGAFPTAGAGAVSYGCGDNAVDIVAEEGPIATGILAPGPVGPAPALSAAPAFAPSLSRSGFGSALSGAGLSSGFFGSRGIAPGLGRGCGAFY